MAAVAKVSGVAAQRFLHCCLQHEPSRREEGLGVVVQQAGFSLSFSGTELVSGHVFIRSENDGACFFWAGVGGEIIISVVMATPLALSDRDSKFNSHGKSNIDDFFRPVEQTVERKASTFQ